MMDDERFYAAWWTCVAEPEDFCAGTLREALGEADAMRWAMASEPGPLPPPLHEDEFTWREAHARWRPRIETLEVDRELAEIERLGGQFLIASDADWPRQVNDLGPSTPMGLWVIGAVPSRRSIAIVGARAATPQGMRVTRDIAAWLAGRNIDIVSGGAFGIDISAHKGAHAIGGATFAVMAGGHTQPYPMAHADFFDEIVCAGGGLISECPPSFRPAKWRFLMRNRLIAALAAATVVVEAGLRSGALSTARRAMDLGRPVGAVPGPVNAPASAGCNEMIRNSGVLIRNGADAAELAFPFELGTQAPLFGDTVEKNTGIEALPPLLLRVWDALPKKSRMNMTQVAKAAGMSRDDVVYALAELELRGLVHSTSRGWARRQYA